MQNNSSLTNLLILSLDCVRPQAIDCFNGSFPFRTRFPRLSVTPNIDYLATRGTRFEQAITHAPFTPSAHASLFTSLVPPRHGIRSISGSRLNKGLTTLADVLSQHGWNCGAVVGAGALDRAYGLNQGFDFYDDDIRTGHKNWVLGERRDAHTVTESALRWINNSSTQPFFLFVHYFDAHNVFHSMDKKESTAEQILSAPGISGLRPLLRWFRETVLDYFEIGTPGSAHDGYGRRHMLSALKRIDSEIGRLLHALKRRQLLEKTLIVVLADHGEDFMEHGERTHRQFLYDTTLRVPLIFSSRIANKSVVTEQVQLVDVFPTALRLLGLESSHEVIDGKDLEGLLVQPQRNEICRPAYAETLMESEVAESIEVETCFAMIRCPPWKLIWNRLTDEYELYNIVHDPGETRNFSQEEPEQVRAMRPILARFAQEMPVAKQALDNHKITRRLRALGYI